MLTPVPGIPVGCRAASGSCWGKSALWHEHCAELPLGRNPECRPELGHAQALHLLCPFYKMAITLAQNKNTWNTSLWDSNNDSPSLVPYTVSPCFVTDRFHLLWQTWRAFWLGIHHSGSQKGFSAAQELGLKTTHGHLAVRCVRQMGPVTHRQVAGIF